MSYEYDSLNKLQKLIYDNNISLTYTYDNGGNLIDIVWHSPNKEDWLDADGDNTPDINDTFPNNPSEHSDTDGDGIGDNTDKFPTDPTEWLDTDNDSIGNNADTDDDNDNLIDTQEETLGTNTTNPDTDGDNICDDIEYNGRGNPLSATPVSPNLFSTFITTKRATLGWQTTSDVTYYKLFDANGTEVATILNNASMLDFNLTYTTYTTDIQKFSIKAYNNLASSPLVATTFILAKPIQLNTPYEGEWYEWEEEQTYLYKSGSKRVFEFTLSKEYNVTIELNTTNHGVELVLGNIDNDTYTHIFNAYNWMTSDTYSETFNYKLQAGKYVFKTYCYDNNSLNYTLIVKADEKNSTIDTDGDQIPDNSDTDDDNDGLTDEQELELGTNSTNPDTDNDGYNDANDTYPTDPSQWEEVNITITSLEDVYMLSNTTLPTITIDANASNNGNLTYRATSSQPEIVTATMQNNQLILTALEGKEGKVNITISATQGVTSTNVSFSVHVKHSIIYLEHHESDTYQPLEASTYNYEADGTNIIVTLSPNGTLTYLVTKEGKTTQLKVTIAGLKVKIDYNHLGKVMLPTQKEVHITMYPDGKVTPHIEGAALPKRPLPLGTNVESDGKKVRSTITMSKSLGF
jgi:hypothetical protein